jgi:hypothetical protein
LLAVGLSPRALSAHERHQLGHPRSLRHVGAQQLRLRIERIGLHAQGARLSAKQRWDIHRVLCERRRMNQGLPRHHTALRWP